MIRVRSLSRTGSDRKKPGLIEPHTDCPNPTVNRDFWPKMKWRLLGISWLYFTLNCSRKQALCFRPNLSWQAARAFWWNSQRVRFGALAVWVVFPIVMWWSLANKGP